jgi:hypothetical protein
MSEAVLDFQYPLLPRRTGLLLGRKCPGSPSHVERTVLQGGRTNETDTLSRYTSLAAEARSAYFADQHGTNVLPHERGRTVKPITTISKCPVTRRCSHERGVEMRFLGAVLDGTASKYQADQTRSPGKGGKRKAPDRVVLSAGRHPANASRKSAAHPGRRGLAICHFTSTSVVHWAGQCL